MKHLLYLLSCAFIYTICLADTVNLTWMDGDTTHSKTTCTIGGDLNVPISQPTKYGYDFIGWKAKAAKELEYAKFQGGGTSYIDTGIMFDSNEIEYETKLTFPSDDYNLAFGAEGSCSGSTNISNSPGSISIAGNFNSAVFSVGSTKKGMGITRGSTNTCGLYINKTTKDMIVTLNENVSKGTFGGSITTDKNIFIGGTNAGSDHCGFGGGRVWYFKIKKDGVLVRDFVPVLDPDGVVCFYDKVTKEFFYNRNGPSLIAGPVIE